MNLPSVLWVLLLPLVVVQSTENITTAGRSNTGSNYEEDGRLYFVDMRDYSQEFSLRKFIDKETKWTLGPYVAMAKGCLLNIIKTDWEMLRNIILHQQMPTDYVKVVLQYVGPLILFVIGLLSGLLFWVCGCCFCCCRSCGKCGGRLTLATAQEQSKTCGLIWFIVMALTLIFLLVGAGSLYTVGQRIPKTPKYVMNVMKYVLSDAEVYVDVLFKEVSQIAEDDLGFVIDVIIEDVDNMPEVVTQPFMGGMSPKLLNVTNSIDILDTSTKQLTTTINNADAAVANLNTINSNLETTLNEIKTEMDSIKSDCGAAPACSSLPGSGDVPTVFDFSATPDLSDQKQLLTDADSLNYAEVKEFAENAFNDVPNRVNESTAGVRESIKSALRDVQRPISSLLDDTQASLGNVTSFVGDSDPTAKFSFIFNTPYIKLIPMVFMGIAGVVFIVVALCVVGLVIGIMSCKKNPEDRSSSGKTSHMTMMCTVFLAFIFMPLYMIPGSILFLVGAPLNMVCAPLMDLSIFDEIVDHKDSPFKNTMGGFIHPDKPDVELALGGVLKECRDNKAVYSVLKLQHKIDVKNIVNIRENLPDMSGMEPDVQDALADVEFLSQSDKDEFNKMKSSNAGNLNVGAELADIKNGLNDMDMSELITKLDTAAAQMGTAGMSALETRLNALSAKATTVQDTTKPQLKTELDKLELQMQNLPDNINDVIDKADVTFKMADDMQKALSESGGRLIMEGVENFVNGIVNFAEQFIDHVDKRLKNDLAKCGIVWDLYDGMVGSFCNYLLDAYNGFWLSLCIIGTFLAVHVIVATNMVNYFRSDVMAEEQDEGTAEPKRSSILMPV